MKCPECGTETRPGLSQCIECGHRFGPPEAATRSAALPDRWELDLPSPADASGELSAPASSDAAPSRIPIPHGPSLPPPPEDPDLWRDELSERVEKFRQRRAQLRSFDPSSSLDFEFQPTSTGDGGGKTDFGSVLDFVEGDNEREVASQPDPLEPEETTGISLDPLQAMASPGRVTDPEWSPGPLAPRGQPSSLDLIFGDEPWDAPAALETEPALRPAPVGRRFLAGLIDGLVLGLGAGVFVLIYWAVGGGFSRTPVTLAVMCSIAALLVLVYFASFTALTFSTPGLVALGLEIRTTDGSPPTPADAVVRAFGVVISLSAVMMGFIWALVDSAGLTWHDRMSGTFVAEAGAGT